MSKSGKKKTPAPIPISSIEKSKKTSKVVKKLLKEHRKKLSDSEVVLELAASTKNIDLNKQECVDLLRGMAAIEPNRNITRDYFRKFSGISEENWVRFFGFFSEFSRCAIGPSRHIDGIKRAISKHASIDKLRKFSKERQRWATAYTKKSNDRIQRILIASDFHDINTDLFCLRVFLDVAKRVQPSYICFAGDLFDNAEMSRFFVDPREYDIVKRFKFVHNSILKPLRENCPNSQIDLIAGNHEELLCRHLCESTPALKILLSDLHGMNLEDLFGLKEFQVNYIGNADLATFTKLDIKRQLEKNKKTYFNCLLVHHYDAKNRGMPGVSGHSHRYMAWTMKSEKYRAYTWIQLGCMCRKNVSYADGRDWNSGFCLAHVDTKTERVLLNYFPIEDFACIEGYTYRREEKEMYE